MDSEINYAEIKASVDNQHNLQMSFIYWANFRPVQYLEVPHLVIL